MPSEEDQTVYVEEDLDDEGSDEEDEEIGLTTQQPEEEDQEDQEDEEGDDDDDDDDDDDEDLNSHSSPSTSSLSDNNDNNNKNSFTDNPTVTIAAVATTAAAADSMASTVRTASVSAATVPNGSPIGTTVIVASSSPDHKRQRMAEVSLPAAEEKKPSAAFDDSRRLFQRLWTDEDEILLLQGFLEYITQRGTQNSAHHHDTGPFYDQIKSRLQLDFNKNQLVEKLRRLKKKYRNVVSRISSGKEFSFKSHHDQATFEISRKIWSGIGGGGGGGVEEGGLEDDDENPQTKNNNNDGNDKNNGVDVNNSGTKVPSSRKRSRKRPAEDNLSKHQGQAASSTPNVIEDTVKSCLSPLFKELLHCATNGPCNTGTLGGFTMNPLPLNFGGTSLNFSSGEMMDEKWRRQQILELEVYSKRLELVQDQIKSALKELQSRGS